jgi:hypothetical protein
MCNSVLHEEGPLKVAKKFNPHYDLESIPLQNLDPSNPTSRVHELVTEFFKESSNPSPNNTFAFVTMAVTQERIGYQELEQLCNQAQEKLNTIDILLDLDVKLNGLEDKSSHEISEEMQALFTNLQGRGVQLLTENQTKLSKEQVMSLKAQIGSRIDRLRTEVQTIATTKIHHKVNTNQTLINAAQDALRRYNQMMEKFIRNASAR